MKVFQSRNLYDVKGKVLPLSEFKLFRELDGYTFSESKLKKAVEQAEIKPMSFLSLKYFNSDERIILYAEALDASRQTFSKIVMLEPGTLTIGRNNSNNLYFANNFVLPELSICKGKLTACPLNSLFKYHPSNVYPVFII